MAVILIVVFLVIFAAGVSAGIVALVATGIRREERAFRLTRVAPDQLGHGTRRITGLYVRSTDPGAHHLQEDPTLNSAWVSANSQIENTYKLMGPPPSEETDGEENE